MPDEAHSYEFSNDQVKALFEMRPGLSEVVERLGIDTREIGETLSAGARMSPENAQFGRCPDLNARPNPNTPVEFNLGMDNQKHPDVDRTFNPTALAAVVAVEGNIKISDEEYTLPIIYKSDKGVVLVTAKVSTDEYRTLEVQAAAWRQQHPKKEAAPAPEAEEIVAETGDSRRDLFAPQKPDRREMIARLHATKRVESAGGEFEISNGQRIIIGSQPHEAPVNGRVDGCIWIEKSDIPEAALAITLDNQGNVFAETLPGARVYVVKGGINGTIEVLKGKTTIPEKDSNNTHFAIEQKNSELIMLRWDGESRGTEGGQTSRSIRFRTEETDMTAVRDSILK